MKRVSAAKRPRPVASRAFTLGSLALGHSVIHWYQQTFYVILPEVRTALALNAVQVGALSTVRALSGGIVNMPAGLITDLFRRHWSVILAMSMAWIGLAYLLVGAAPTFALALPAIALVGAGGAIWHPPAISTLSLRFADRRGLALSLHGVGGSLGDTLAPLAVGAILIAISWRTLLRINALPAVALALLILWALRNIYASEGPRPTIKTYFGSLGTLVRNRSILFLLLIGSIRAMGQQGLLTFLPIYMRDELHFNTAILGLHLSFLTLLGMGSQPVMGFLSDRFGRKAVLAPGMLLLGLLTLALVMVGGGFKFTLVIILLGLFVYALQAIFLATALDLTGKGVEAATVGLFFGMNQLVGSISPLIAGALVEAYDLRAAFLYIAAVFLLAAFLFMFLPLKRTVKVPANP
ncbi:MAG: MFS transporter [Chloroflexi bacterium]|nr:MFS transporter [Chloroflexota bacterium]